MPELMCNSVCATGGRHRSGATIFRRGDAYWKLYDAKAVRLSGEKFLRLRPSSFSLTGGLTTFLKYYRVSEWIAGTGPNVLMNE